MLRKSTLSFIFVALVSCTGVFSQNSPFVKVTDPDGTVRYVSATPAPGSNTPRPVKSAPRKPTPERYIYLDPNIQHETQYDVVPFLPDISSPVVEAEIDDKVTVKLLVDTGASISVLSKDVFMQLDVRSEDIKGPFYFMTAGGLIETQSIEIDSLSIGNVRQNRLDIMIAQYPSPHFDGLLGQDFLSCYRYEINPETREISFHQLGKGKPVYGGNPGIWWQNKFGLIQESLANWEYLKSVYTSREFQNAADVMIKEVKRQLNRLDTEASRVGLPREFREAQ